MSSTAPVISVCSGLAGMMAGSSNVIDAFEHHIKEKNIDAEIKPKVHKVGCLGLCAKDVLVDIFINGQKYTYQRVTSEMVEEIVDQHLIGGKPVKKWLTGKDYDDDRDKD